MRSIAITALLTAAPLFSGAAAAQASEGSIELKTVVEQEIAIEKPNGEIELRRVPAGSVIPGEDVIYTIHATNTGFAPAADVVITDPIPEHTRYKDGTAIGTGAEITFSVDGGKSYDQPANLKIVNADGTVRPAVASDYTTIRWKFTKALDPGESRFGRFRATLQ